MTPVLVGDVWSMIGGESCRFTITVDAIVTGGRESMAQVTTRAGRKSQVRVVVLQKRLRGAKLVSRADGSPV